MFHLKLIKGLSYSGIVRATARKPDVFTEDKAVRDAALASGYFAEAGEVETVDDNHLPDPVGGNESVKTADHATELSKMTTEELKAYASINGIPLGSAKKKEAILKAIKDAEDKAAEAREALRNA